MSHEISKEKDNSNNNSQKQTNGEEQAPTFVKKLKKEKKTIKKAATKTFSDRKKVVPLLKPPSRLRRFNKNEKETNQENSLTGIVWDNKTIEEQYLERKLHPRLKIDEPKTPYPGGNDEDIYEEGLNKVNEIKPTEELLNNVVAALNEKENDDKKKSNIYELKKKAYTNEYTHALKFYEENKEKFDDLSGERKICLENTLINKFQKEIRSLSKEKDDRNK